HVPRILAAGATVLLTWDTGDPSHDHGGGRVVTILAGPGIRPARISTVLSHYSILASVEAAFGLPRLRQARFAPVLPLCRGRRPRRRRPRRAPSGSSRISRSRSGSGSSSSSGSRTTGSGRTRPTGSGTITSAR